MHIHTHAYTNPTHKITFINHKYMQDTQTRKLLIIRTHTNIQAHKHIHTKHIKDYSYIYTHIFALADTYISILKLNSTTEFSGKTVVFFPNLCNPSTAYIWLQCKRS